MTDTEDEKPVVRSRTKADAKTPYLLALGHLPLTLGQNTVQELVGTRFALTVAEEPKLEHRWVKPGEYDPPEYCDTDVEHATPVTVLLA